jgi:hypothetical protein
MYETGYVNDTINKFNSIGKKKKTLRFCGCSFEVSLNRLANLLFQPFRLQVSIILSFFSFIGLLLCRFGFVVVVAVFVSYRSCCLATVVSLPNTRIFISFFLFSFFSFLFFFPLNTPIRTETLFHRHRQRGQDANASANLVERAPTTTGHGPGEDPDQ